MFSTLRGFLNRHKKKFIVTAAVIGGTTLAISYAQRKLREWQEEQTKIFFDISKKKTHFESIERNCNQTILNLVTSVSEAVMKTIDTQPILDQLDSNPSNKAELWEELKVTTFARATTIIYSFTILVVTSRIQLNLIGGYIYKDSIREGNPTITNEHRLRYMSLCNYFVTEGIERMSKQIYSKIKNIITPISLKQKMTLKDTEQLFWSIQAALCADNCDPLKQVVSYMITDSSYDDDPILKSMINETMDLLESDEVISLSISSVSRSFSVLFDNIAEFFTPVTVRNGTTSNGESSKSENSNGYMDKSHLNSFVNINNVQVPFISLIPIINRLLAQSADEGLSGLQLKIIEQLVLNDKLKVLGANIYEVFSN